MGTVVTIHGNPWKWSDIADAVNDCRAKQWAKRRWTRRPALVDKGGGSVRLYSNGRDFDPDKFDLVPDGWSHDHCEICWWTLHETDDPDEGIGYEADDGSWICQECYERFIAGEEERDAPVT